MQQATPRQFRCAGPMLVKDNSPAHLDELRQVTTRFSNHIKYIALYKQAGVTRLIAQAHGKLSITQWRSFLGTGVHTITHNSDMRAVILEAKQQEAFEEHVSTGKTTTAAAGRAWVLSHVDASQEQMIHVPLLSPVPVPDHHRQEDGGASSTAQTTNNNTQYVAARVIFLKALEETESQKGLPPKPPADLSLADYTPPPTSIPTMDEILTQGRERARDIYLKALEDYAGGIHHHHQHQCAGGGKRTWTQALHSEER
jgi:hypothetical protein